MVFLRVSGFVHIKEISAWAKERGITIAFYKGWANFISQVAFWSEQPQIEGLQSVPRLIYDRLIEIEASEEAIETWVRMFQ